MARRRWVWTSHQLGKMEKVKTILEELKDYKPLTLRQVYYQLVSKGFIENKKSEYGMLSNLLKWARIDDYISWDDIEDRIRVFHTLKMWDDKRFFITEELNNFLKGYNRNILQSQRKYIETWIEKDALSSVFNRVCLPYGVPVVVCRGFSSVSFLNEFRERLWNHSNKEWIMLYFGDFDPSGVEMLNAMKETLEGELDMPGITFKRIALTKNDIFNYHLPHNPDALKKSDTRAKKHLENYGELAVELDALRPDILTEKIEMAIQNELDITALNEEVRTYQDELDKLNKMKKKIIAYVSGGGMDE